MNNKYRKLSSTSLVFMKLRKVKLRSAALYNTDCVSMFSREHVMVRLVAASLLTLFLSLASILSLQLGRRSCLSASAVPDPATRVAVVVTVVVAVEPGGAGDRAGLGLQQFHISRLTL